MKLKPFIPYIGSVAFLAIIALLFCAPIFKDLAVIQPDIIQYKGMAQEAKEFSKQSGENTYWSNAMFGGMPTYQTGAQYDSDVLKYIDRGLRFLPRPADYIFLSLFSFFILGVTLLKDWKMALLGAVFFGLGTYFVILIAAGHNAKLHTIAYFPAIAAGVLLLYNKKWFWGFLLTTLFLGLEIRANHPQMTFYFFLGMLCFAIVKFIETLKSKDWISFIKPSVFVVLAGIFALAFNAPRLWTNYEYAKETIRGESDVDLVDSNNSGLDKDYITQWSYGKLETLNVLVPNFMGGESGGDPEQLKNYSKAIQKAAATSLKSEQDQQLLGFAAQHQMYWGDQPFTSGPAYQGAIVVFLFILGIFLLRGHWNQYKWWLVSATLLSVLLAWGKNLSVLTDLFIDFFPLYDKFRAVSSILVIAEFTMPLLALLCIYYMLNVEENINRIQKTTVYTLAGFMVLFLIMYIGADPVFGLLSGQDLALREQFMQIVGEYASGRAGEWSQVINSLEEGIKADRIDLLKSDVLRSTFFVLATAAIIILYTRKLIQQKWVVCLLIGFLALIDVFMVGKRYLNQDNFVPQSFVENPYPLEETPKLVRYANKNPQVANMLNRVPYNKTLQDLKEKDSANYRVFNNLFGPFQEANTSYFHHSIGGYHGAKLQSVQNVIDLYFSNDEKAKQLGTAGNTEKILNLLNAKYIIGGELQKPEINYNPDALGNAWFVNTIKVVDNANQEILALKDLDLKQEAVVRKSQAKEIAKNYAVDSLAKISLGNYAPNSLTYDYYSKGASFAVFSEIFYSKDWKAKVNGKELPITRVNYLLRGLELPAGKGQIVFEFNPKGLTSLNILSFLALAIFIGMAIALYRGYEIKAKSPKADDLQTS